MSNHDLNDYSFKTQKKEIVWNIKPDLKMSASDIAKEGNVRFNKNVYPDFSWNGLRDASYDNSYKVLDSGFFGKMFVVEIKFIKLG